MMALFARTTTPSATAVVTRGRSRQITSGGKQWLQGEAFPQAV